MSYEPEINREKVQPDDIDRLFELMNRHDPPPGDAFEKTFQLLFEGEAPSPTVVHSPRRSGLLIASLAMAATLVLGFVALMLLGGIDTHSNQTQANPSGVAMEAANPNLDDTFTADRLLHRGNLISSPVSDPAVVSGRKISPSFWYNHDDSMEEQTNTATPNVKSSNATPIPW